LPLFVLREMEEDGSARARMGGNAPTARPNRGQRWWPTRRRAPGPSWAPGASSRGGFRARGPARAGSPCCSSGWCSRPPPPIPPAPGPVCPTSSVSPRGDEEKGGVDRQRGRPSRREAQRQGHPGATRLQRTDVQERNLSTRLGGGGQSQPRRPGRGVQGQPPLGGRRRPTSNSFPQEGRRELFPHASIRSSGLAGSPERLHPEPRPAWVFQKAKALRGRARPEQEGLAREAARAAERDGAARGAKERRAGDRAHWSGDAYEGHGKRSRGRADRQGDGSDGGRRAQQDALDGRSRRTRRQGPEGAGGRASCLGRQARRQRAAGQPGRAGGRG